MSRHHRNRTPSLFLLSGTEQQPDLDLAKAVLCRWVNHQLKQKEREIKSLEEDLCDGVNLCMLLEILSNQTFKYHLNPTNKAKRTENIAFALDFMTKAGLQAYGWNAGDIESGDLRTILDVLNELCQKYVVSSAFGKPGMSETMTKAKLLKFCKDATDGYSGASPTNFDSSFQDSLTLCAILNRFFPTEFSFDSSVVKTSSERAAHVIEFLSAHGVPRLFQPEEICRLKKPDDFLMVIYLCLVYNWLLNTVPDFLAKVPTSDPTPRPSPTSSLSPSKPTMALPSPKQAPAPVPVSAPAPSPVQAQAPAPVQQTTNSKPAPNPTSNKFLQKEYEHPIQNLLASELDSLPTKLSKQEIKKVVEAVGDWWRQELEHIEVDNVLFNAMGEVDQLNEDFVKNLQTKLKAAETQLAEAQKKLKHMSFSQLRTPTDNEKRVFALEQELADAKKSLAEKTAEVEQLRSNRASRPPISRLPTLPPSLSTFARQSQDPAFAPVVPDDDGETTPSDDDEPQESVPAVSSASPALEPAIAITARVKDVRRADNVLNRRTWISQRFNSLDDDDPNGEVDDKRMIYDFDQPEESTTPVDPTAPKKLPKTGTLKSSQLNLANFQSELESTLSRQVSVLRHQKPAMRSRVSTLPDVVVNPGGFRLEDGTSTPWWLEKGPLVPLTPKEQQTEAVDTILQHPLVENPEYDASWYLKYFYLKEHQIFIGDHDKHGPFVVSIIKEDVAEVPKQNSCLSSPYSHYRAMIWLKTVIERVTIPDTGSSPSIVQVMSAVCPSLTKGIKELKVSTNNNLPKQLLKIEEIQTVRSFKFGVLYVKEGQTLEEQMFGNKDGSPEFDEFLSILGDKVKLDGFNKFRGGLDNKQGKTGEYSVYTSYCGYEIMFHVSTLLPHNENDHQQLERKRHIGNDICCIVFQESSGDNFKPSFSPKCISSHFLHVFVGVRVAKGPGGKKIYSVNTISREDVPHYGPALKNPPTFESKKELRDFILTKLINGETSTYQSPAFMKKMMRTLEGSLQVIATEHGPTAKTVKKNNPISGLKPVSLSSRATISSASVTAGGTNAAINNSLAATKTVLNDLHHEIVCGDRFGNDYLVGTSQGLFFYDGSSLREIKLDKKRKISKVNVVEPMGIVITICTRQPGGHPYIVLFELDSIRAHLKSSSNKVKETKINESRLSSHYAIDAHWDPTKPFYMIAHLKKSLLLFVWQSISKSFKKIRQFSLPDVCQVLALRGSVCFVGLPSEFNCINIDEGDAIQEMFLPQTIGSFHVSPLDVIHLEKELLICYNNQSIFVDLEGKQSREYVIKWTSFPHSVVYLHPFVIGFMRDSAEIRTLLNGALIQSVPIQSSTLLSWSQREHGNPIFVANNVYNPDGSMASQVHAISVSIQNVLAQKK